MTYQSYDLRLVATMGRSSHHNPRLLGLSSSPPVFPPSRLPVHSSSLLLSHLITSEWIIILRPRLKDDKALPDYIVAARAFTPSLMQFLCSTCFACCGRRYLGKKRPADRYPPFFASKRPWTRAPHIIRLFAHNQSILRMNQRL